MARKHVLTELNKSNFTKEELEKRLAKEAALKKFEGIETEAPEWLDAAGRLEYERIVPLLEKLPIASLDQTLVALYCRFYSLYLEASKDLDNHGLVDGESRKANPAFSALVKSSSEIRLIASQLGMTIDSRMKLVVPASNKPHDPFEDFFKEEE